MIKNIALYPAARFRPHTTQNRLAAISVMTKPGNTPTVAEVKASQTSTMARKIIERATKTQNEKTARLRAQRLQRDASAAPVIDGANPAPEPEAEHRLALNSGPSEQRGK